MNDTDSWQCQGRDEKGRFSHGTCGGTADAELATPANIRELASIPQTEAGGEPPDKGIRKAAKTAVGFTVMNRMRRNHVTRVRDVSAAYASFKKPEAESMMLARQIHSGELSDPTHGATHFYSPVSMPKEGQHTNGRDVRGGLESTPGVVGEDRQPVRNYRPSWAAKFKEIWVPEVPLADFRFFRQPGDGHVW